MVALDLRRATFERIHVMRFTFLFCVCRYPKTAAHFRATGIKVREANQRASHGSQGRIRPDIFRRNGRRVLALQPGCP
ncbi:hypothetical protein MESS4_120043 [Mesorhizobium sp. STM 4661]|nr:hypothetical protein MESS4_120043 [Mesorhizobium sp. STM 4661]